MSDEPYFFVNSTIMRNFAAANLADRSFNDKTRRTIMKKEIIDFNETWMNVLRKKSKDELMLVMYDRAAYTPNLIALTKKVLKEVHGCTDEELLHIPEPDRLVEGEAGARNLLLEMLCRIGCEKSIFFENDDLEDDGTCPISFHWDNHLFYGYASNESAYVSIVLSGQSFKLQNKEKVTMIKEAVNRVNEYYDQATLYYAIDEKYKILQVNCRSSFLFIPLIPDISLYFFSQLKSILETYKLFLNTLKEMLVQTYNEKRTSQ